jgi:hypothetical protein|tara:strand:- start:152 stop:592 length:441 start_codon:yes stop_codon:yes gene_type:complete
LIKRALIISLILNSIIIVLVPEGHGGGIMILFEILLIPEIIENRIDIGKINFLENNIGVAIMLSLIGKLILISSLFVKKIFKTKIWVKIGLIFLLISFLSICFKAWNDGSFLFAITLGSGIPFLIYWGRVLYLINKEKNKSELVTE